MAQMTTGWAVRWGDGRLDSIHLTKQGAEEALDYLTKNFDGGLHLVPIAVRVLENDDPSIAPPAPSRRGGKVIPFRQRKKNPPTYEESHWGETGKGRHSMIDIPDPREGPLVVLGERVKVIVYETIKGGDSTWTEYEHKFESPHPKLIYNGAGKLLFGGGGYTVTERGIVR